MPGDIQEDSDVRELAAVVRRQANQIEQLAVEVRSLRVQLAAVKQS